MRRAGLAATALLLAATALGWWRAQQSQRALRRVLAEQQQQIAAAQAAQRAAQQRLAAQLAEIERLRRRVRTPAQVAQALPHLVPLPAPVRLEPAATPPPAGTLTPEPELVVPAADLGPLWNFLLECRAAQARLEACQRQQEQDERIAAALRAERDAALRAARGRRWQQLAQAAKWIVVGAVIGAAVAHR